MTPTSSHDLLWTGAELIRADDPQTYIVSDGDAMSLHDLFIEKLANYGRRGESPRVADLTGLLRCSDLPLGDVYNVLMNGRPFRQYMHDWRRSSAVRISIQKSGSQDPTPIPLAVLSTPASMSTEDTRREITKKVSFVLRKYLYSGFTCNGHWTTEEFESRVPRNVEPRGRTWRRFYRRMVRWFIPEWQIYVNLAATNAFDISGQHRVIRAPLTRFYADPFVIEREGKFIFFEDFSEISRRGRISAIDIRSGGKATVVLERPYHLSYPFVFEHESKVYMVPESSAAHTVDLYEAVRFPYDWAFRGHLFTNSRLSDCTVHFDSVSGYWYLFCTDHKYGAPAWDNLCIFYARSLEGPWRPHARNPVKMDARSSRPAGRLVRHEGRLVRPTQDCSLTYGGALTLCRVNVLTPLEFEETPFARIAAPSGKAGVHTVNSVAGVNVFDVKT